MVRASVLEQPHVVKIHEFAKPAISENDGLLRVELAGICATDVKIYEGKLKERSNYPIILGHEIVGIIEEIGQTASDRWQVQPGDRVAVDSFIPCGACYQCLTGHTNFCRQAGSYGTRNSSLKPPHLWGSYSQYLYLAPQAQVFKLDKSVTPEEGVLVCAVLANGIKWVERTGIKVGSSLVIQGPGSQGLAAVMAAREMGAYPIIVTGLESDKNRLSLAQELGADYALVANPSQSDSIVRQVLSLTEGEMADAVLDVTGAPHAMREALALVKSMGTVVFGGLSGGKDFPLVSDALVFNEVTVKGVLAHDVAAVKQSVKLANQKKYPLGKMITKEFPLEEAEDALLEAKHATAIKAVINPWR